RLRLAELRIAAVAMLDLRSLKLHGARISMRRQSIKDRSSRIAESQQLGDFIERLSRRVIASVPDIAVSPEMIVLLRKIKMGMPARHYQRQHRELQLAVLALPLLQQHGVNVSLEMVHRQQRLIECECQCLGETDAHEESSRQARPLRHGNGIDRLITLTRFGQSLAHDGDDRPQMLA